MMNDQSMSSLAAGTQTGVGIVSWGDYAEGLDAVYEPEPVYVEKQYTGFNVWKDMADEPWKYGNDMQVWLDLDDELRQAPGHWRLEGYWTQKEIVMNWKQLEELLWKAWQECEVRREKAATRIQALWRGHMDRNRTPWRDCCMCLAHHVSPIHTDVGYMCSDCSSDGPHSDLIGMEDPWDWFRSEV